MYPNSYYNFLKNRKEQQIKKKDDIKSSIKEIYHSYNGILGHRMIQVLLFKLKNIRISKTTVHKYMNKELRLYSITRKKRPEYRQTKKHKIFDNLLKQNFASSLPNAVWCTDFTYIRLVDGSFRYNCTIIDLYDRRVVVSITDKSITSELAIRALEKALNNTSKNRREIILHSDQGSQFTSKKFVEYYEEHKIIQSMSKAGCPYDNAPMERYFNTLKSELLNHYHYKDEKKLYNSIEEFAYVWYNHVRPHSYNGYKTPYEARHNKVS